ncbi:MAG: NUDIX domain-containing protein [Ignavibacteria bacterium]
MPVTKDKSVGVIVYCQFPRSLKYLILKHKKGHWSFAKGHKDKGETQLETAKRELLEEAGIKKVNFISKKIQLKENYSFSLKNNNKIVKEVSYFIAETNSSKVKIDKNEIRNYKWCTLNSAQKLITYDQSKKTIKKANKIIINKKNKNK